METLVMCRIDRGLMVFMRKNYPYVANEQFELGILKAEDNEEEEDELTVDLDLQKEFSSQWPTYIHPKTLFEIWLNA